MNLLSNTPTIQFIRSTLKRSLLDMHNVAFLFRCARGVQTPDKLLIIFDTKWDIFLSSGGFLASKDLTKGTIQNASWCPACVKQANQIFRTPGLSWSVFIFIMCYLWTEVVPPPPPPSALTVSMCRILPPPVHCTIFFFCLISPLIPPLISLSVFSMNVRSCTWVTSPVV